MTSRRSDISGDAPSRSQRRREALAVLALARRAVSAPPGLLAPLALPERIREAIARTRAISSPIARKRETGFLAKLLRADPEAAAILAEALAPAPGSAPVSRRREALAELWCARLLADGDAALERLVERHRALPASELRRLLRAARGEAIPGPARSRLRAALVELLDPARGAGATEE